LSFLSEEERLAVLSAVEKEAMDISSRLGTHEDAQTVITTDLHAHQMNPINHHLIKSLRVKNSCLN